ncbi:MAG: acyl carrier protein [Myxococcota bacterium]
MRQRLAMLVGAADSEIDIRIPIERYGVDSRTLASMAGELEDWIGFQLPATLLWDHPTIEGAAEVLSLGKDAFASDESLEESG